MGFSSDKTSLVVIRGGGLLKDPSFSSFESKGYIRSNASSSCSIHGSRAPSNLMNFQYLESLIKA